MDQKNLTFGLGFEGLGGTIEQMRTLGETISGAGSQIQSSEDQARNWGTQTQSSASQAAQGLDGVRRIAERITEGMEETGAAGADALGGVGDAAHRARDSLGDTEESTRRVGNTFRDIGRDAESLGGSVRRSAGTALQAHGTLTDGMRAGMQGALGFTESRLGAFAGKMKQTAQNGIKFFKGPTTFIQEKFYGALEKVGNRLNNLEDESEEAGDSLKDMGKDGQSAGSQIKDAIGGAVAAFAAFKIATSLVKAGFNALKSFASSMISVGVETEKVGAKFDAVFEGTAVAEWAGNFADAIHRSESEVKSFLTSNKKMYTDLGITGTAADDLSKITTSLAYDMGAAFNMEDAEALGVIQDYIGGNTKALSEYGVQIDDAILKQTAMDMGLGSNIAALDDASAAQVRMTALLENGSKIQQIASEKQTGYANNIKNLKGVWSNFMEGAAQKFVPVFSQLTDVIIESWPMVEPVLMGLVTSLSDGMSTVIPIISDLASGFLPELMSAFGEVGAAALPLGSVIMDLAMTALPPLVSAVGPVISVISDLAKTILPPFASIISNIASTVVPPLVNILKSLSENVIQPLIPHFEKMVNALLPAFSAALSLIPPALQIISPILDGIGSILSTIIGYLGKIVEWAASGLGTVLEKIAGVFGGGGGGGASVPHNALGTSNFQGGATYVNEEAGELAVLPSGTQIIPADRSEQLINQIANNQNTARVEKSFNPTVNIQVSGGGMDEQGKEILKREMIDVMRDLYAEWNNDSYMNRDIQLGNV